MADHVTSSTTFGSKLNPAPRYGVSVIIPTYNRADWLKEAIETIAVQTYANWELIVVDDGSTDHTTEVIQKSGVPVKHIRQERKGVSAARNTGIRESTGQYIAFLDSDDLWKSQKLAIQVDFLERNTGLLLVHTEEIWIRNGRRVNPRKIHKKHGGWIFDKSLALCLISPSSVVVRRELFDLVGFFDENLPACEDYDLWLRVTSLLPVGFIPEPLIVKRGGHDDQLSQKHWGMDRFRVYAILKLLDRGELSFGQRKAAIGTIIQKCDILIAGARKRKKFADAEIYESIRNRFM